MVEDDRLLLVRRGRSPALGQWSVPGGRVEPGETLAAAVEREVAEETGLVVRCGPFIGWVERIGAGHHFVILDFWARPTDPSAEPIAGDDAAEVAWIRLADLGSVDLVDGLLAFLTENGVVAGPGRLDRGR